MSSNGSTIMIGLSLFTFISFIGWKSRSKIVVQGIKKDSSPDLLTLDQRIAELEDKVNSEESTSNDRLDVYETRVTLLEKKLSGMASHEKRISSLGQRVSDMQDFGQRIFQIEHNERHQGDKLRLLENRIEKLENEYSEHRNILGSQNHRLQKIEVEKPIYTFFQPSHTSYTKPQKLLGTVTEPLYDESSTGSELSTPKNSLSSSKSSTPERLETPEQVELTIDLNNSTVPCQLP